jgi:hypothetical protein
MSGAPVRMRELSDFSEHVGHDFTVETGEGRLALNLTEASGELLLVVRVAPHEGVHLIARDLFTGEKNVDRLRESRRRP